MWNKLKFTWVKKKIVLFIVVITTFCLYVLILLAAFLDLMFIITFN